MMKTLIMMEIIMTTFCRKKGKGAEGENLVFRLKKRETGGKGR